MTSRKSFLKQLAAAAILGSRHGLLFSRQNEPGDKIWACLLHLSFNMWEGYISPHRPFRGYRPYLELSEPLWRDSIEAMAAAGMNMAVIDLGDAVRYESHPEIAVGNAWTTDRLRIELARIRELGMEPVPKLNFSAAHDAWMGRYSRMVSTGPYHAFCSEIIAEVSALFGKPRFFHLGMDEENMKNQMHYRYVVIRQQDQWWKDFLFLAGEVEKNGSRPWIWSDYYWDYPDSFLDRMPASVVQSNWYYQEGFGDETKTAVKTYLDLEANGYDQIPTASFHADNEKSILNTVEFCSGKISDERLLGFLQTFWKPMVEEHREQYLRGIELIGGAKKRYEKKR